MALWRDGVLAAVVHRDPRSHAERLPTEATAWLEAQGVSLSGRDGRHRRVDAFAVVAGPGSFTGLRVGVAATQGWAFATGTPVIGVPTLDAVAADPLVDRRRGVLVVPLVDGQRSEVFFSVWRDGIEVAPARAARPDDAIAMVRAQFAGAPVVAIGDGASKYASTVETAGWTRHELSRPLAASAVCLAATGRYPAAAPHAIRPIYVRRPDAEVARGKREATR